MANYFVLGFFILLLISAALGPTGGGMPHSYHIGSRAMQQSRTISDLLANYAVVHQGIFPTGQSSTEIFQKLVDQNGESASDMALFYLDMPGKKPATNRTLRPENVCFDATLPLKADSPGALPVVFVTGYKVSYVAGGTAVPIDRSKLPNWAAVSYADHDNWSVWSREPAADHPYFLPNGSIANFIPASFDPKGMKYTQLTPDGPLP